MFRKWSYPILGTLIPPSPDEDINISKSLLRLEHICACAIARSEKNCQILSKTPAHLFKIILRAYLKDSYYSLKFTKSEYLVELFELMYHWPHEELLLVEAIPEMPRRLASFPLYSEPNEIIFDHHEKEVEFLFNFYKQIAISILVTVMITCNKRFHNQQKFNYKMRKINLTGLHIFEYELLILLVESFLNSNDSFTESSDEKLELIIDICFDGSEREYGDLSIPFNEKERKYVDIDGDLNKIVDCCSNSSRNVTLKYGNVLLSGTLPHRQDVARIIDRLINEGTKVVSLTYYKEGGPEIVEEVLQSKTKQGNVRALDLGCSCINSLDFLEHFENLIHLDLLGSKVHGCLDILQQMQRGLVYLNLKGCDLYNDDLGKLIGSHHQKTLRELNLGYNILRYDNHSNNLIKLCENMPNLVLFNLAESQLDTWPINEIEKLFHSFNAMPSILKLDLQDFNFSPHFLTVSLMILRESPSLRYLELDIPSAIQEYHSDLIKSFCSEISVKINDMRSQLLYVDFTDGWNILKLKPG